MNKRYKKIWVDSLRSGKYKQGKGRLKAGNTYCCLGVLCDALGIEADEQDKFAGEAYALPISVAETVGLTQLPYIMLGLDNLNDAGMPFNEIADLIEEQL